MHCWDDILWYITSYFTAISGLIGYVVWGDLNAKLSRQFTFPNEDLWYIVGKLYFYATPHHYHFIHYDLIYICGPSLGAGGAHLLQPLNRWRLLSVENTSARRHGTSPMLDVLPAEMRSVAARTGAGSFGFVVLSCFSDPLFGQPLSEATASWSAHRRERVQTCPWEISPTREGPLLLSCPEGCCRRQACVRCNYLRRSKQDLGLGSSVRKRSRICGR